MSLCPWKVKTVLLIADSRSTKDYDVNFELELHPVTSNSRYVVEFSDERTLLQIKPCFNSLIRSVSVSLFFVSLRSILK